MNILKNKKIISSLVVLFLLFFVGYLANAATEDPLSSTAANNVLTDAVGSAIATVIGWIALLITSVLGLISTVLIDVIVKVAQYNNIINVEVVRVGWVIVRDLCNMFFVLIFLIMAFATILRVESYNFKKMLPKLLMYAVLINFSRTIFGLIIDASTIIMLTFVGGFANLPGKFTDLFLIDKTLAIDATKLGTKNLGPWTVTVGIIMGVIASALTVVILAVILAVLVMRVIMLWIYTILSPLAFLGFGFDPLKKFTQEIWDDFIKAIIVGPVLAFFIYLSFYVATSVNAITTGQGNDVCTGANAFFCSGPIQKYIIVIAMLMGGLKVSQKIGGEVSKIAGKTENWTKGKIKAAGNKSGAAVWGGVKTGGGIAMGGLKAADATWNKGRGASYVGVVQDRYKSVAKGAAAGAAVGSIGGFGGAGIGGLVGGVAGAFSKNVGNHFDNKRKLREAQGKINEKDDGAWYSHNGHDYKADDKGKFRKFDKSANNFVSDEVLKIGGKDLVNDRTEEQKRFSAHYRAATNKGKASREVAEKEGVDKAMKNYNGISPEDLKRLFETETDKKNLKALAMLLKGKFKDGEHAQVNKAKDLLSGNELMNKDFSEAMMKNNAYLYNTRKDGSIDTGAISKAFSEGKIKLEEQSLANLNADAMKTFANVLGDKFETAAGKMVKNTADADRFKKIFKDGIASDKIKDFSGDDLAIRRAFSKVTGDLHTGFQDKGGSVSVSGVGELMNFVNNMNVKDYSKLSDEALQNSAVQKAIRNTLTASTKTMDKINKSNDLTTKRVEDLERIKNGESITP